MSSSGASTDPKRSPATPPAFVLKAGAYVGTQTVAITGSTPNAAIYYTTNSTTPTASSTLYTGPITVTSTETIEAIAKASCCIASAVSTATYTISHPATPTITWAAPAAIAYGKALSGTQLDATSPVAGTFTYTPTAGTVLKAGKQSLSVSFKPTDTTDYSTAAATVMLTVNPAPL